MPKKFFSSENPKAAAARERKKKTQKEKIAQKQEEEEVTVWEDNDKLIKKKQDRKEEQNKKREKQLAKKAEAKLLLEHETNQLKSSKTPQEKLTRAQIGSVSKPPKKESVQSLQENLNRVRIEGIAARSVDEAIAALSLDKRIEEKHPEKRRKAAFNDFEKRRVQELKNENPTLRLSQLKDMVFKEWQKSPENPTNQVQ